MGAGVDASLARNVRLDRPRSFLVCVDRYVPLRVVQRQPSARIQQPRLRRGHASAEAVCWRLANELVASICDEGNGRYTAANAKFIGTHRGIMCEFV